MATAEWYCYAYQVCKEWAESLGSEVASASATELFQLLLGNDTHGAPVVQPCPGDADIDPTSYGLMVASLTELTSESPLASFRQELYETLIACETDGQISESWLAKDLSEVLCEVLLYTDVEPVQSETKALCVQAVISFGHDAIALLAFLLVCRAQFEFGRGSGFDDETQWVGTTVLQAIDHAREYLVSEYAPNLSLLEIMQSFPS
eukprot:m.89164 g.89164  ORF g.89164 m.89164 type:complete len:206 (+) comp12883_c1_seq5:214-831(+)